MTLRISGKSHPMSAEALRAGGSPSVPRRVLRKYFDGNYSGHLTLSKDGFGFPDRLPRLHLDSGITLEAESNARRRVCQRRPDASDDRKSASAAIRAG